MPDTRHLVVTVHGIRTYGPWQADLKALLEQAEPGITVLSYQFGFFSSLAFLVPPIRWLMALRFRRFLVKTIEATPPNSRIDLVAHSFGTYLVASALRSLPAGRKIDTIIFAGSVLRPAFPWYKYQQANLVGRVVNECGWDDTVLLVCQASALLMGMAGRIGFQGMVGDQFVNRYYRFGHGGYFDRDQQFMRTHWVPLLTGEGPIPPHDERPALTAVGGLKLFVMNNMQFIKVALAGLLLFALVAIPIDWHRNATFRKRVDRLNAIALLTNAQDIPGRDPSHIRELLKVDAQASGDASSIDRMIGTQAPGEEIEQDLLTEAEEETPQWWERLPGLYDYAREARLARIRHAHANRQLVAGKKTVRNLDKGRASFENALRSYQRASTNDPALGSYALCLLDYGRLLAEQGDHNQAITQFRKVREDIFPRDAKGQAPDMPPSLVVDSLIYEAESLKMLQRWDDAADRLAEAIKLAKERDDDALLSDASNSRAWLAMDRLEVAQAFVFFEEADQACTELVKAGRFLFKVRLYHIRHGRALATRLEGRADEAYTQYQQIVKDLQELMVRDLDFTPKQRRDLRDRMINSMERLADVRFFARQPPAFFGTTESQRHVDLLAQVEDHYEDAIRQVANDDLNTKTRLLFKKTIARFLAELERDPEAIRTAATANPNGAARPRPNGRRPLEAIDVEFAEAERTYDALAPGLRAELAVYRDVAADCMNLRASQDRGDEPTIDLEETRPAALRHFSRQAVQKLRDHTVAYAENCERLKREHVEMLLLAHEILLDLQVATDLAHPQQVATDATRMMAVLGATTKVASHEELRDYFQRFQTIAMTRLAAGPERGGGNGPNPRPLVPTRLRLEAPASPSPSGEVLRFYLRLMPGWAVKIVQEPGPPQVEPVPEPAIEHPAQLGARERPAHP